MISIAAACIRERFRSELLDSALKAPLEDASSPLGGAELWRQYPLAGSPTIKGS
jgi:hypothetical protein